MVKLIVIVVNIVLAIEACYGEGESSIYFPLLMPEVQPTAVDSYLCTAFRMPTHEHRFIVEYLPNATMETAHHILIYGCKVPGYYERDTPRAVWNCGEMAGNEDKGVNYYPKGSICGGSSEIIYAWAMDAPKLQLPEGVGFMVGGGTDINYLVLQVHYAHVHRFLNGDHDHSGVTLRMLPSSVNSISKRAGVYILGTDGRILPHSVEHFETACEIQESVEMHPFAFRTHTHKLGMTVAGFRIDGQTGRWHMIGKHNPQEPQMFYPVGNSEMIIRQGDTLAARCTMYNNLTHTVRIGLTGDDEMCNFYIMYYIDRLDRSMSEKSCFSPGPPNFYWRHFLTVPRKVDREASQL